MFVLAEDKKEQNRLLKACEKTAFGCKIAAIAASYGFEKSFSCFWLDTSSETVYCMTDGLMLISGTVLNGKEARAFLHAVGPKAVMCAVRNAEELELKSSEFGDVLKKQLPMGDGRPFPANLPNIREIYSLLEENGMVEEFEPFYLDLSHRLRHGTAVAVEEYRKGGLAGCAVVSAISRNSLVLSALAVRAGFRRQGIGSSLVKQIEQFFPGKTAYVFRNKDENKEFYHDLGYAKTDTWIYAKL